MNQRTRALDAYFTPTVVFRSAVVAEIMLAKSELIVLELADFDIPVDAATHQANMALDFATARFPVDIRWTANVRGSNLVLELRP